MPVDELQHAVELVSAGHQDEAAVMLSRLVTQDPKNEAAWLWLSVCLNEKLRKIYCLEQVLKI
ncbi:MAG: ATP synthase subunit I, partial [Anaerolineaceae bacterium]|nr:ATP synthase subunit I [Anaerolineaceae bacterium]